MTMKPQKPLPRPQQAQVQVDLNQAETLKCKDVITMYLYKHIY